MKIKDRAKPKTPPVDAGVYMGVCVGVIDLGEQYSEMFKNYSNKLMFIFDLPTETIEVDGKQEPRQLSREFTVSTGKKAKLREFLESWNVKSYTDEELAEVELFEQLGKPCMLTVVLNETKEYANIASVTGIPKGIPAPTTPTELISWDMDAWNEETLKKLPEWIQEKIKKSTQFQKDHAPEESIEVKPTGAGECPI